MYEERFYRSMFSGINLTFFDVCVLQTDLRIGASRNLYNEAFELIKKYREQIEEYIKLEPLFLESLEPVKARIDAPVIIKRMYNAAEKAGVGPMAAVAGAVSEMVGCDLLKYSNEIIVENGGDIFIKSNTVRKVGIYAGKSPLNEKIALEILPQRTPIGICTSSGTVGHSLSFGKADAAIIISTDTFLADAVATATGNIIKTPSDINKAIDFASGINGVEGVVVIIGDKIGAWGDVKLVSF